MKQILSVVVQNNAGILSRVASLLRRKCFNIDSLTVGRTSDNTISRMTIVILGDRKEAEKVALQLDKLIEIQSVEIMAPETAITREIAIARLGIHTNAEEKKCLKEVDKIFHTEIYRNEEEVCVELIDTAQGLDHFLDKMKKSDIEVREWIRSGIIAIKKPKN